MPNLAIKGSPQPKPRQVVYDAGEKLKGAVDSILTNDSNQSIDANISRLEGELRRNGVRDTRFVGRLLYCFRGVQQGVRGDLQKFKQAVQQAQSAGALGPRGAASLLSRVGELASQQDSRSRVENSILNVKNQPAARKPSESLFDDVFQKRKPSPTPAVTKSKPAAPQGAVSPTLERAITSIDLASKAMPEGVVKSALEAVQSSLELAKEAQAKGDPAAYSRAIADLGSKTFALVGALVKSFGQNPELAAKAASQLGTIASVLGKVAGPLKAMDSASRVFLGQTLGGAPVDKGARAEAAYDLVSSALPAPIQAGLVIGKLELEALYNHIGVPVHRAIEEYGLKRLFNGKTPEQLKAAIEALPTDEANANATVRKLLGFFPNTTSGFSQATANGLWRSYMAKEMAGDAETLKAMVNQDPKKPNAVPEMLREVVAERMVAAAKRFIDAQVREARGNW